MVRADRPSSRLHILLRALVLLLPVMAAPALANEAQLWIFNAGVSLGMAKAQMRLIGLTAEPEVIRSLGETRDSMLRAQGLFTGPLATFASASTARTVEAIDAYSRNTQGASANAKDGYIAGIFWQYRPGFESTFDSTRPDAAHRKANCDLYMLLTGFSYGQAWIAATQPGSRARFYQTGQVGEMQRHIQNGILVSMDKGNVMVRPTVESEKACCCFGMRSAWERLPTFTRDSPADAFASTLETVRAVVRSAGVEGCLCGGGIQPRTWTSFDCTLTGTATWAPTQHSPHYFLSRPKVRESRDGTRSAECYLKRGPEFTAFGSFDVKALISWREPPSGASPSFKCGGGVEEVRQAAAGRVFLTAYVFRSKDRIAWVNFYAAHLEGLAETLRPIAESFLRQVEPHAVVCTPQQGQ